MSEQTTLCQAIVNGNKEEILQILQEDIDLTTITDENGDTALHLVFRNTESSQAQLNEILEILIDRGIDINAQNKVGKTILHLAVERRMRDVIDFCVRRNADLNVTSENGNGNTIAHFVVEEEFKKFNLLFNQNEPVENLKLLENESSSFVDWMASQRIDFFYKTNQNNHSALYLANELNLQHILLTLLRRIDDLPSAEDDHTPLLYAFLEMNCDMSSDYYSGSLAIDSRKYESRHVYNIVKILLDENPFIDDKTLNMAIRLAIENKDEVRVIELLLERIPMLECRDYCSPLVIQCGPVSTNYCTKLLLEAIHSRYIKWSGDSGIEADEIEILRVLVFKGADINVRAFNEETVAQTLFRRQPTIQMLKLLKEWGVDFSVGTLFGGSFLMHASKIESSEAAQVVEFLINEGCDVNAANSRGETPLSLAIVANNVCMAIKLIEVGANVNYTDIERRHGRTYLHLAVEHSRIKMIELLLKNGADVNAKDNMGKTPLHLVTHAPIVKVLFNSGANVNALDKQGVSPLYDSLTQKESTIVIEELLKYGADVRDPTVVFELLQENFPQDNSIAEYPIFRYLIKHLMKLAVVGLYDKNHCASHMKVDDFAEFAKQCRAEFESLQTFFIDDGFSLYNLLHTSTDDRCAYVDNGKLKNLVEDGKIERKFPKFFVLILACYNKAKARKYSLEMNLQESDESFLSYVQSCNNQ